MKSKEERSDKPVNLFKTRSNPFKVRILIRVFSIIKAESILGNAQFKLNSSCSYYISVSRYEDICDL